MINPLEMKQIPIGCDQDLTMQENTALKLAIKKYDNTFVGILVGTIIIIIGGMVYWYNKEKESKKKYNLPSGKQKED